MRCSWLVENSFAFAFQEGSALETSCGEDKNAIICIYSDPGNLSCCEEISLESSGGRGFQCPSTPSLYTQQTTGLSFTQLLSHGSATQPQPASFLKIWPHDCFYPGPINAGDSPCLCCFFFVVGGFDVSCISPAFALFPWILFKCFEWHFQMQSMTNICWHLYAHDSANLPWREASTETEHLQKNIAKNVVIIAWLYPLFS